MVIIVGMNDNQDYDEDGDYGDDDDFDYEQFVEDNYGQRLTNTKTKPIWRLVAVVLLLLIGLSAAVQIGAMF